MNTRTKKFFGIYLPLILIVIIIFLASFFFRGVQKVEAGWYSTGGTWTNRKQITIDHNKVGVGTTTPLTNFPMLFSVTDNDLRFTSFGGQVASSTGLDIVFTASDGTTKLDYEMDYYASTTGQVVAWVRIPSLSPSVDTVVYVYFGNASASDQSNKTSVWDSNYKAVYHLANGTTLSATDSTSNSRNGTLVNTPTATTGQIDGAASGATASHQYISFSDTGLPSGAGVRTLSGWVKETSFAGTSALLFYGTSGSAHQMSDIRFSATNVYFEGWSDDMNYAGTINTGTWYYITGTFDGTNGRIYVNGSLVAGPTALAWNTVLNGNGYIGHNTFDTQGDMNGARDEVRISNTVRSADWIKTEYNNQSSPSTFYLYSANQTSEPQHVTIRGGGSGTGVKIRGGGSSVTPTDLSVTASAKGAADALLGTIATDSTLNIASGDLIVAIVMDYNATARTVSGITDGTNALTYVTGSRLTDGAGSTIEMWYKENASVKSSATFTATLSGTAQYRRILVWQIAGAKTSGALDKVNTQAKTNSIAQTVSNIITTQADEIIIAGFNEYFTHTGYTANSGFTKRLGGTSGIDWVGLDRIVNLTGAYPNGTVVDVVTDVDNNYIGTMASFKASGTRAGAVKFR